MKILLIAPGVADDLDSLFVQEVPYMQTKVLFGPHAVVTVAALTPAHHEVTVHDEHMRGPSEELARSGGFDVIGISLTTNLFNRAMEIARFCKEHCPAAVVVAGGIGAENLLARKESVFDVVIHGEAEETWPRFLRDLEAGKPEPVYRRVIHPVLTDAPTPRWDLIAADIPAYSTVSVQTTRGCPFDCDFCDVIYTYGRRPRSKSIENVLAEISTLQALGARMIFIADDNFGGGDRSYAKALLRRMVELNRSFDLPLNFMTQVDILVSKDPELLELFADANFLDLMIGIESVDRRALEGMNKLQNLRVDLVEAVRTIQSYGIAVLGHMIIGSDTDDLSTFGLTATFVEDAQILHHFCHPLMAPPGTRLWYRLAREGRLVKPADGENDRFDIIPNIQTANMTRVELLEGLADYWEQVFSPEHYVKRALGFLDNITRKPAFLKPKGKEVGKTFRFLMGIIGFFMFKAEAVHRRAFFRILRKAGPMGPAVVQRAIFLYTCFMMDMKRAWHDAAMARQQAVRERANPGAMVPESGNIPLSQKVIEHVSAITGDAYASLRPRIAGREQLYRAVVEAMIEYSDRFGATLADYDDFQRDNLLQSCERVAGLRSGDAGDGMVMPDSPPAGFSREIMDSVDNALRVRQMA